MKQLEKSKETHEVNLEMFDVVRLVTLQTLTRYSNSSHVRRNCDSSTLTMPVNFVLDVFEGTVASEVGIPGLSHIPIGSSRME
jgi:hypothetical protein